jgi:phosphate transport system substrate-binding protein
MFRPSVAICILAALVAVGANAAEAVKVHGSPVLGGPLTAAGFELQKDGVELKVTTEGGSTNAVRALGFGLADMAMVTRRMRAEERADFPGTRFTETRIGVQTVAILVPRDVWNAGVRAISKEQLTAVYEGRIKNWKELGGEDRAIKFYNGERGRGVWEFFAYWLYDDIARAPLGSGFETVVNGEDARNSVAFNAGSMSMAAVSWVDGKSVFALAIKDDSGTPIEPTLENISSGKYPIARPAILIVAQNPLTGAKKRVIEFMLSKEGQAIVKKADLVPVSELPPEAR